MDGPVRSRRPGQVVNRRTDGDARGPARLDVLAMTLALSGRGLDADARALEQAPGFPGADGIPPKAATAFVHAVEVGDLDHASALLSDAHPSFAAFMDVIQFEGAIARGQANRHLVRRGIRVSAPAANALATAAIHLGQAYTTLGLIRDGSRRPPSADLALVLRETAEAVAEDGLVRVSDLLGPACARARISPHALGRALDRDGAIATMAGLHLPPSAGGPVRARDAVLAWSEDGPRLEPVPTDRFRIGQRPVLVCTLGQG